MAPRQRRLTLRPVRPILVYCMYAPMRLLASEGLYHRKGAERACAIIAGTITSRRGAMFRRVVKSVLGDPVTRALARYQDGVESINALEPEMQALDETGLRMRADSLRQRLRADGDMEAQLVETFALVRETSLRTIGLRPYDVQLIGGMVLHQGRIAEMKTGEGKTLVATLPLVLNSLAGNSAHLVTPNDYLSKVGLQQMGPIYHMLGLSASVIQNAAGSPDDGSFVYDPEFDSDDERFQGLRPVTRREAYACDIVYGTNNEFGFDYLRDNMVMQAEQMAQRKLNFAIVDEVDNILIDEARTAAYHLRPGRPALGVLSHLRANRAFPAPLQRGQRGCRGTRWRLHR